MKKPLYREAFLSLTIFEFLYGRIRYQQKR